MFERRHLETSILGRDDLVNTRQSFILIDVPDLDLFFKAVHLNI